MDVALTPDELVRLAAPQGLPPGVGRPVVEGPAVLCDVDPRELPGLPGPARLAARAAGTARVTASVVALDDGLLTLEVAATVRGMPAHRLVSLLLGPVSRAVGDALESRGLPDDAVRLVPDGPRLLVVADTRAFVGAAPLPAHLRGLRLTGLHLGGGRVHAELALA